MANFLEQVAGAASDYVRGVACDVGNFLSLTRNVSGVPYPTGLWPYLCPDEPPPPEAFPPDPPFSGGQCECVNYIVSYSFFRASTGVTTNGQFNRKGPIGGPLNGVVVPENPNRLSWGFRYGSEDCGGRLFELLASAAPDGDSGEFTLTITSVVTASGAPDECGSPPPPPPPPPSPLPPGPPEDRPVTDPDGGPDIDFTFAPSLGPIFVDIDGSLKIPVNVNVSGPNIFAPINVPVNISLPDFNPTFNIGGGGGGGNPAPPEVPCCDPPAKPGPEVDGDENQPIEIAPAEPGRRLYAVRVRSTVNEPNAQATKILLTGDGPDLWVPRIGSVIFELEVEDEEGSAQLTTSIDYDVKTTDQLVLAPEGVKIKTVFISPAKAVSVSATPLFKVSK